MSIYPGNLLTATPATVSASPTSTGTWEWLRNNVAIPSATSSTYRVTEEDIGSALAVLQKETNFLGVTSATSLPVGPIQTYSPSLLFAAGEQGAWYDPSDLTTMFQDTAGTTPVSATGQAVGLLLDKSKGLVLGSELVTNGDFSAGSTGWITTSWVISGGKATISNVSDSLAQNVTLTAGKAYRVEYTLSGFSGTGAFRPRIFGGTTVTGTSRSADGTYVEIMTAVTGNTQVAISVTTATCSGSVDNISVKELAGNHAVQATAANRPIYGVHPFGGRRNLLTWSQDVSNAVWVGANGWSATNSTTVSASASGSSVRSIVSGLVVGQTYTLSMDAQKLSGAVTGLSVDLGDGGTAFLTLPTASVERLTVTRVVGASGAFLDLVANGAGSFYLSNIQLELGSTATAYQRVTDRYNVTEAGVPSVSYLFFDGVNDSMSTSSINFTATNKMNVFVGARKLVDTGFQSIVELSPTADTNAGSFCVGSSTLNGDVSRRTWASVLAGTSAGILGGAFVYAAPLTGVLAALYDIAQSTSDTENILRVNGVQQTLALSPGTAGTLNFNAYPLFIGARNGAGNFFNGNIYSIIVRGALSSSILTSATEGWVASKTGVVIA